MSPVEHLMLDAKQALLEEQHRRFQALHQQGRSREAMRQFQATLGCACDLLNEAMQMLERATATKGRPPAGNDPASSPPNSATS